MFRPVSGWVFFDFWGKLGALLMAGVAQLVRAPVCGTGGRRFKTGHSPHFPPAMEGSVGSQGRRAAVRMDTVMKVNVRAWRNW